MSEDRRRKFRLAGTVAVAVVAALGLVACSAAKGKQGGSDAAGARLTVAIKEPDHIVPGLWSGGDSAWVIQALFAPLIEMDSKGAQEMVAAESVTTKDNRVWTIKLKPWKFQNGESITAQNYVDTVNANAYGPNAWAQSYATSNIDGFAALNPKSGKPSTKTLSGLKIIDKLTFQVTLVKADAFFPSTLASWYSAFVPLPPEAFRDLKSFEAHPIGNGPYKINAT